MGGKVYKLFKKVRKISIVIFIIVVILTLIISHTKGVLFKPEVNINIWRGYIKTILVFNILFPIVFLLTSIYRVFYDVKNRNNYESEVFKEWYSKNIKHVGESWMIDIYNKLGLHKKQINILSPSANEAVYEIKLYDELVSNNISVNIDCSDLCPKKVEKKSCAQSTFKYSDKAINALKMNQYSNNSYDIIFDIKGALWHNMYKSNLINLIKEYEKKLNKGGIIVIDASKQSRLKSYINCFAYDYLDCSLGVVEVSTYQRFILLKTFYRKKYKVIKNYIEEKFRIEYIGIKNKKNDVSVIILKKK